MVEIRFSDGSRKTVSNFEFWLRTGRLVTGAGADQTEAKFNPWHDPTNGQFTFAGGGTSSGRPSPTRLAKPPTPKPIRAGGGSNGGGGASGDWVPNSPWRQTPHRPARVDGRQFGGGGASGSWPTPSPSRPQPPRSTPHRPSAPPTKPAVHPATHRPLAKPPSHGGIPTAKAPIVVFPVAKPAAPTSEAIRVHIDSGYRFRIDQIERPRSGAGELRLAPDQSRSKRAQAGAGKPDRRPTDEGGHIIGRRFGGPTASYNHFAQDAQFNRGRYKALEDLWERSLKAGKHVTIHIELHYRGPSRRPDEVVVEYIIDGNKITEAFSNAPKERKSHD